MSNIKVAVRVRPLSKKEAKKKGRSIIQVRGNVVTIENPEKHFENILRECFDSRTDLFKHFIFDFAFSPSPHRSLSNLFPPEDPPLSAGTVLCEDDLRRRALLRGVFTDLDAEQELIYREVGIAAEVSVVKGYNACILAYGQSGSGKTYTVLGCKEAPGLSPRICKGILERLQKKWPPPSIDGPSSRRFTLSLSLIEIYKERVRDLLTEVKPTPNLKVREHPTTGPYVDGVTWHNIGNVEIAWDLLERGRAARSVGPTSIHLHSSRSHALMTLKVGQPAIHTRSSLTLVDLAGSERASETSDKNRLKEGASINRSLVTLGNVISALADKEQPGSGGKTRSISCPQVLQRTPAEEGGSWGCPGPPAQPMSPRSTPKTSPGHSPRLPFIPYRDSVLTWLLKDTLGGNSNTFMIATLSPSSTCYKESLSTLRYATRARRIVNRPVVNVDPTTTTISSLREEITLLRQLLFFQHKDKIEQLTFVNEQDKGSDPTASPKSVRQKSLPRVRKGRKIATTVSPTSMGLNGTERDVRVECGMPYLINTLNDEFSESIVIYHLKKGTSVLGKNQTCDLRLQGQGVNPVHCSLTHGYGHSGVTLRVLCGCLQVDNSRIVKGEVVRLKDGDTIRIGSREFTFRLATRKPPKKKRPRARHTMLSRARILSCLARPIPQCHRKSKSVSLPLSYIRSPRWTRSWSSRRRSFLKFRSPRERTKSDQEPFCIRASRSSRKMSSKQLEPSQKPTKRTITTPKGSRYEFSSSKRKNCSSGSDFEEKKQFSQTLNFGD